MSETVEEAFQGLLYGGCCDGQDGHGDDTANREDKARAAMMAVLEEVTLVASMDLDMNSPVRKRWEDFRARIEALGEAAT